MGPAPALVLVLAWALDRVPGPVEDPGPASVPADPLAGSALAVPLGAPVQAALSAADGP